MKRAILSILGILLCQVFLLAQTVSIAPNPVMQTVQANQFEGIGYSTITNGAAELKNFRWERRIIEITPGWQIAICDINQCYDPIVGQMEVQMAALATGAMDVHAYPGGLEGYAIVEVTVTDLSDTTNTVTGRYFFNDNSSSTAELSAQQLNIYPNPTQGLFTISDRQAAAELQVFNIVGKRVRQFNTASTDWYDLRDLPKGTYTVRMLDRSGQVLTTKLLQKI